LNSTNAEKVDLAFPTFNSIKPSFSYAKVDQHNFVCEVAEKEVISNTAICSVYLISNPTELNKSWNRILDSNIPGERYLSSLARDFLLNNKKVKAFDSEQVKIYGTPESIETNERYQ
jgi:hypothetical protein